MTIRLEHITNFSNDTFFKFFFVVVLMYSAPKTVIVPKCLLCFFYWKRSDNLKFILLGCWHIRYRAWISDRILWQRGRFIVISAHYSLCIKFCLPTAKHCWWHLQSTCIFIVLQNDSGSPMLLVLSGTRLKFQTM